MVQFSDVRYDVCGL